LIDLGLFVLRSMYQAISVHSARGTLHWLMLGYFRLLIALRRVAETSRSTLFSKRGDSFLSMNRDVHAGASLRLNASLVIHALAVLQYGISLDNSLPLYIMPFRPRYSQSHTLSYKAS
jgi:hypothetical protein